MHKWNSSIIMGARGDGDLVPRPEYIEMTAEVYAVIVLLSILSVMGTAGNALVLYVFYQKKDKQVSTLFIIVLAFVDFITCLVIIPYTIVVEARHYIIDYDVVCKLYHFLITSNIPFSALIMVAIAVDRYLCICHPFLHVHILNLTRAKVLTLGMALFAATLGVTVSLMFGVYREVPVFPTDTLYHSGYMDGNHSVPDHLSYDYLASAGDFVELPPHHFGNPGDGLVPVNLSHHLGGPVSGGNGTTLYIVQYTGQCRDNQLILTEGFRWYYQRLYTTLYLVCLVVIIVLYSLIYRSVLERRTRRARQRSKALPLVQIQQTCMTEAGGGASVVEETLLTQVNGEDRHGDGANGCSSPGGGKSDSRRSKGGSGKNGGSDKDRSGKRASNSDKTLKRKSTKARDHNRLANLKTAAMLFVVTVVFIVTFLPALLMALTLIPHQMVVYYMYFANNVANPVIYSFMNKNFRDDLRRIFCKPQIRH